MGLAQRRRHSGLSVGLFSPFVRQGYIRMLQVVKPWKETRIILLKLED